MTPYVFDTETADLEGGVCEIGIIRLDEAGNITGKLESLIDPERPISAGSGGVHGIRDEDVADAPTLRQFAEMHDQPFRGDPAMLIGYNVGFDIRVTQEILPKDHLTLDLLRVARNLWPQMENHQLQTLAYAFRLTKGPAHRALGDVITAHSLLLKIMADTGKDLMGIYELSQQPLSLDTYIWFGKHGPKGTDKVEPRGTKLRDLPKSYIRWYLGSSDVDPDLERALRPLLASPGR